MRVCMYLYVCMYVCMPLCTPSSSSRSLPSTILRLCQAGVHSQVAPTSQYEGATWALVAPTMSPSPAMSAGYMRSCETMRRFWIEYAKLTLRYVHVYTHTHTHTLTLTTHSPHTTGETALCVRRHLMGWYPIVSSLSPWTTGWGTGPGLLTSKTLHSPVSHQTCRLSGELVM